MATDKRIRSRIAQRLRRNGADPGRIDLDVEALPEAVRSPDPPTNQAERAEGEDLDRDAHSLHATYRVGAATLTGHRRRPWTPLVLALRRFAVKVLWPVLEHQSTFNGAVARSVSNLMNRSIRHTEQITLGVGALTPTIRAQAKAIHELERRVRILEHEREGVSEGHIDGLAFANRFRGDEENIRDLQLQYVELFAEAPGPVLDFGSGRGEFLELLQAQGIAGHGVDSDAQMVEHTRAKGLAAEIRDGFAHLEGLPPSSLGGIFAAQVIEHLELQQFLRLLRLARRALAAGGVMVLETHNPQTFLTYPLYAVDPTHVRLYHHETVAWLLEQEGFSSVEIRASDPVSVPEVPEGLNAILHGHLTYAAIAHQPRP